MLSEEQSAAPASSCSDPALLPLCPSHVAGTRGFYLLGKGMWLLLSPLQAQVLGLSMYLSLRRTDRARTLTCSHTRWHSQGLCTHLTGLPLACWPSLKFAADAVITGLSSLIHKSPCAPNMDPPVLLMPQSRQFLGPHWLQCLAHAPQKSTPWPGTSIWHLLHSHQSPPAAGAPGSKSVGPLQIQIATAPPATDIGTPLAPAAGTHFTLSHTHGSCQELAHSPSARIHMEE